MLLLNKSTPSPEQIDIEIDTGLVALTWYTAVFRDDYQQKPAGGGGSAVQSLHHTMRIDLSLPFFFPHWQLASWLAIRCPFPDSRYSMLD